jgi:hypothetical protein
MQCRSPQPFQGRDTACSIAIDHRPKVAKELHVAQEKGTSGPEASEERQASPLPMLDRLSRKAYGNGKGF